MVLVNYRKKILKMGLLSPLGKENKIKKECKIMRLEDLKKDIEAVDLSNFKHILLENEEEFLAFMFDLSYEHKYQFYSFQHVLDFHATDIKEVIKTNLQDIKTKEDIRNLFIPEFYDFKFQWNLLDEFLKTIE